jgi:hypothetical protein
MTIDLIQSLFLKSLQISGFYVEYSIVSLKYFEKDFTPTRPPPKLGGGVDRGDGGGRIFA